MQNNKISMDGNNNFNLDAMGDMTLGNCLEQLSSLLSNNSWLGYGEELEAITSNYQLMKDYMKKGFADNSRQTMYSDMLLHAKGIASKAWLKMKIKSDASFSELVSKANKVETIPSEILSRLQDYVQDLALASISIGEPKASQLTEIYNTHHTYIDRVFCAILIDGLWSKSKADDMAKTILSPTVDIQDAMLLTSAITIATLVAPDYLKVKALISIFQGATDEHLRQRALVGWVIASMECRLYRDEVKAMVEPLLKDEVVRNEILEMSIQTVFCNNAEKDHDYLEHNVFPDIMKNHNFDISKNVIIEKEDDALEDILHPDAADKKIDEIEQSMRKMADMQKAGADIYFGGFKQMKRYAFFYTLSNWFAPFNINHPTFNHISADIKESPLLKVMLATNTFCDNDKYSLVLGMASMLNKIPANMKDALPSDLVNSAAVAHQQTAADIRRMYLQDLYRFFKVYPQKHSYRDVFAIHPIILGEEPFAGAMSKETRTMVKFVMKRGENALPLMCSVFRQHDEADCMLLAYIYMKKHDYKNAYTYYNMAFKLDNTNDKALKGSALSSFHCGDYGIASQLYDELINKRGESSLRHQLYYSMTLIKTGDIDNAVNNLYRLSFEFADNAEVLRALALGLALQGKIDKALSNYLSLHNNKANTEADNMALAYCYGSSGDWAKAAEAIQLNASANDDTSFYHDYIYLSPDTTFGISHADIQILNDIKGVRK